MRLEKIVKEDAKLLKRIFFLILPKKIKDEKDG